MNLKLAAVLKLSLLTPLLGGCVYTSFPLIPAVQAGTFPSRFETKGFVLEPGNLSLKVKLRSSTGSASGGFLSVVWFEEDAEVGRDSIYLDLSKPEATFRFPYKPDKTYRASLIFKGDVVRQFEYEPLEKAPAQKVPVVKPKTPDPK